MVACSTRPSEKVGCESQRDTMRNDATQALRGDQLEALRPLAQLAASQDSNFRQELLANPTAALQGMIRDQFGPGLSMPEGLSVRVLAEATDKNYVIVPSLDKVEGLDTQVANFARAIHADPALRDSFQATPAETVACFLREGGVDAELPRNVTPVLEGSNELFLSVPMSQFTVGDWIDDKEFNAPKGPQLFHSPTATCTCTSDGCTSDTCNSRPC